METSSLKITSIQTAIFWENPERNLAHFDALIDQQNDKTDLIVLPEVFNTGFPVDPKRFAETTTGKTMAWMRRKAQEKQCVVCGSLLLNENECYHNSFVWMRPDGSFELYHKRHAFKLGGEEQICSGEKELIVELNGWKIKPFICYDLRFPVWSRNRFSDNDFTYDLAIYTANWPASRAFVWNQLLIARAIENQSYVLGVNRIGTDGNGLKYSGDSKLIDAKGTTIADFGTNEQIMNIEIEQKTLIDFRQKFCIGKDWDRFSF